MALAVAMGIGRFAFTPILPMMHDDAGVSIAAGGWLASANYLGYLLGAMSAMRVQIRAASAIRGGLVTIGLATLGMGLETRFSIWIVLRVVAGVASAWVMIYVAAWCLKGLTPARRPFLGSVVFTGVGASIAFTGMVCVGLMRAHLGSAAAWTLLGLLALVLSISIWPLFGEVDGVPLHDTGLPPHATSSKDGEWLRLVLCYGASGFGYIIPATFLPVMARELIRDPAVFGWSWPVFGIASAVSTLATGLLRSFVANRRVWVASHLVMAFGVALPVLWSGITAIMLAALCVGSTFMVNTMAGMQEARNVGGAHPTGLMAAMTSAFALGQIIGPLSVSYLVSIGSGFSPALLIAGSILVTGAYILARPGPGAVVPRLLCGR